MFKTFQGSPCQCRNATRVSLRATLPSTSRTPKRSAMLSALKFSFNTLRSHRCNHGNQCATKHTASKQHFGAMSSFCRTEKQRLNFKVLLMPIGLKPEGLQLSELSNRWWQDAVKLLHFIQGNLATKTTAYSEQTNLQAFQLLLVVVTKMHSSRDIL